MMRAWESRTDCSVVDEPFYGCYLQESGARHPMRDEIIASQPRTRDGVIQQLSATAETTIQYEKHMTHHMPAGIDLSWTGGMKHVFLIRAPDRVIASYRQKMPSVSAEAIGIIRQRELFDDITVITGSRPPVIDSLDLLRDPEGVLRQLCHTLSVPWQEGAMTTWRRGRRRSDGIWASHWYASVETSTHFSSPPDSTPQLDEAGRLLADLMTPHFDAMARFKLS